MGYEPSVTDSLFSTESVRYQFSPGDIVRWPDHPGDVILTRPGELHVCVYHQRCRHLHYCIWIDAPADSPLVSFMHEPGFRNWFSVPEGARQQLFQLLAEFPCEEDGR